MRQRIFGRQASSSSKGGDSTPASRHSKDGTASTPVSPAKEKEKDKEKGKGKEKDKEKDQDSSSVVSRQARSKKSLDGKGGERLSIFGASFSSTLGKSRKPPPRYSTSCVPFSFMILLLTVFFVKWFRGQPSWRTEFSVLNGTLRF